MTINKRKSMSYMAAFAALVTPVCLNAQISVTASAGTPGATTYTSLNAAFAAINLGTHQGVISIQVTGNTTEPATAVPLLASGGTAVYTSISIKPAGGSFTINSATAPSANRGIIELAGADNVTIDGDDPLTPGLQNLSIIANTVTTAGVACIRLSSNSATGTDGADNNTVKNCIIAGSRSSATGNVVNYAIQFSNGTGTSAEGTGAYSSINTTIQNNLITRCAYAIHAIGNSTTYLNTGTRISGNTIGSATPADYVSFKGIDISYSSITTGPTAAVISNNDVRTGQTNANGTVAAIDLAAANTGILVTRNNIHDCINTSTSVWGMYGIGITSATSNSSITITNNFIRDIQGSFGLSGLGNQYGGHGIFISAAATNVIINNNTIVQSAATIIGSCIQINTSAATILQMLNNILVNTVPSTISCCFYLSSPTSISGATVNNNNYFVAANAAVTGYYGATQLTLADWKTATGKDGSSYNEMPSFVSATDLHIVNSANPTFLESTGALVSVTGVADDIDSQNRPGPTGSINGGGTAPDIGADEFDGKPITCFAAASGSVSAITYSSATFAWTQGLSTPSLWEVYYGTAPLAVPVSTTIAQAFATGTVYTANNLTSSTPYSVYVRANCGSGDYSPWLLISVFRTMCQPPVITSVTGGSVCASGTINLQATAGANTEIYWYNSTNAMAIATGASFITPSLSATTNYSAVTSQNNGTSTTGIAAYSPANGTTNSSIGYGINFNVLGDVILRSVVIYPQSALGNVPGTVTIGLVNSAGTILQQVTTNVTGYPQTTGNLQPQTVNLNFALTPGTGYKLVLLGFTGISNLTHHTSSVAFPYTIAGLVSLVNSTTGTGTSTSYYDFFNWTLLAGCFSAPTPVVATVHPLPSLIGLSTASGTICAGTSVSLLTAGSSTSYTWSPSGEHASNITVSPLASTVYTVTGEAVPHCARTITIAVAVKASPLVTASAANAVICAGETASLSAQGTATSYVWSPGGSSNTDVSVTPAINTTYTVTGYGNNGCAGTGTVSITVNPALALTMAASKQVMCKGETISLYAISPATSYAWSNGSTTSTTSISPATNTTYSVTVSNGTCTAMASVPVIVEVCTGIDALSAGADISVYPNPANEVLTISLPAGVAGNASVLIYDATGKLVKEQALTSDLTTIGLDQLNNGIYLFNISTTNNNRIKTGRIVKQ